MAGFGSSFGGSFSGSFGSGQSSAYPSTPHSSGLTLRELMLLNLVKQPKAQNAGFLQAALHGAGHVLGSVGHPIGQLFHNLERPFHGVEEGMYQSNKADKAHSSWSSPGAALHNIGIAAKGFEHGFMSGNSHSGADIAQQTVPALAHHHFLRGVSGFGVDVAADPLSFVGFGVKGTKEVVAARRTLLNPKDWWDINKTSSSLKKAVAAGVNPENLKYRKALNLMDRKLYKSAKGIAALKGEGFQSKNSGWLDHLFKESTHKPELVDLLTQRGDLASMAYHESMLHDPRFKTIGFAGKDLVKFGKNVATKEHNSALAKLFSNVSRYGPYYPLSIIGLHSGARADIIRKMVADGKAPAEIRTFIKEHEMKRVRTVLAHGEGIPLKVTDKTLHAALKKESRDIVKLHDIHGVPFSGISIEHPGVMKALGLDAENPNFMAKQAQRVGELYKAHGTTKLQKLAEIENPAAADMKSLGGQFKGVAVSKGAKSFLAEYRKQFLSDENLHQYMQKLEHGRAILKRGYTGANPFGYAIRNSLTDVWNAALTHTPVVRGMAKNSPKAFRMIKQYDKVTEKLVKGEKLTGDERHLYNQVHRMHDMGILSGLFAKDVQEDKLFMNQINSESGRQILKKTKGRRLLHAYATGAVHANETRENTGRMAHYLYRMSKGEAPEEAAEMVKRAHFDYSDVTPFEQKALKSIFPFYTWYRKNIPFQMRMIAEKPGQFLRFTQAAQESAQASGDKKQGNIPDYLKDSPTAFRLPFGKNMWANPALGMQDLQTVEHPISDTIQKIGPPANLVYAYLAKKDNFAGTDLNSGRLTPTNSLLAKGLGNIPFLNKVPGMEVGKTRRQVGGKEVNAAGISPWLNFLIGQVPASSLVTAANPVSVGHRGLPSANIPGFGPIPTGPALSYFGGQTVTAPNSAEEAQINAANAQKQATAMLQKLYDSGTLKPRVRKKSSFDRMFAKAAGG